MSMTSNRPKTAAEAQRRFAAAEARPRRDYTVDELHAELFGVHTYAGAPAHEPVTGVHTHDHPAYQLGDGMGGTSAAAGDTHMHPHEHFGDANHDHHGGQAPPVPGPVSRR